MGIFSLNFLMRMLSDSPMQTSKLTIVSGYFPSCISPFGNYGNIAENDSDLDSWVPHDYPDEKYRSFQQGKFNRHSLWGHVDSNRMVTPALWGCPTHLAKIANWNPGKLSNLLIQSLRTVGDIVDIDKAFFVNENPVLLPPLYLSNLAISLLTHFEHLPDIILDAHSFAGPPNIRFEASLQWAGFKPRVHPHWRFTTSHLTFPLESHGCGWPTQTRTLCNGVGMAWAESLYYLGPDPQPLLILFTE